MSHTISEKPSSFIFSSEMKLFCIKVLGFVGVFCAALIGACFGLPDRSANQTMLVAQRDKCETIKTLDSPRVILVGGSGIGLGVNSAVLAKKLVRPVYNMGLHAGLGLIYQMRAVTPFIKDGDVVVLFPEYSNFDDKTAYGNQELVAVVADILPEHRGHITMKQWFALSTYVFEYGAGKIRRLFSVQAMGRRGTYFDENGDGIWTLADPAARRPIPLSSSWGADHYSPLVVPYIAAFKREIESKHGQLIIMPPAVQSAFYGRQEGFVARIDQALRDQGLAFAVRTERYALPDEWFYDTPYHLNLLGRNLRAEMLAEDLSGLMR